MVYQIKSNIQSLYSKFQAVQCEWSTWNVGECSHSCNGGLRFNTRKKVKTEIGTVCEGESAVQEKCNEAKCPGTFQE